MVASGSAAVITGDDRASPARDRVGHAGVQTPSPERREQVGRLPDEQYAPVLVDEPVGDDLQELVGRDPGDAVGVPLGHHLRDPVPAHHVRR